MCIPYPVYNRDPLTLYNVLFCIKGYLDIEDYSWVQMLIVRQETLNFLDNPQHIRCLST